MAEDKSKVLPALPPSDETSLEKNAYHSFYQVGAKDFWGKSDINSEEVKPFNKCKHDLTNTETGIECKICHVGWEGSLRVQGEKLYVNGKEFNIQEFFNN